MVFWREPGLVLDLQFAERSGDTVYDLSGNGNHGTVYGAVWRRGPLLGALKFDGVDDYVEIPDSPELRLGGTDFTIEVVIEWHSWSGIDKIVDKTGTASTEGWSTRLYYDTGKLGLWFNGVWHESAALVWELERWYHIVFMLEGSTVKIYRDAVNVGTISTSVTLQPGTVPVKLGGAALLWAPQPGNYSLALVRIYNRALSEWEIKSHYNYVFGRVNRIRRRMVV